ncbi:MAG: hypothetical protein DELT_01343 [Desulfovibrio sp.]
MADTTLTPTIKEPVTAFTQDEIVWKPWLMPIPEAEITDEQKTAFKSAAHVKSEYFRLLARDIPILKARSKSDQDIFYTVKTGLPRAERELAAVAVSRKNGCIYCASVHARFSSVYSKRKEDVNTLLEKGLAVDLAVDLAADLAVDLGGRWNAIISASAALTETPAVFGKTHIAALRDAGLSDLEIMDVINCAAFFNWANRLMLSLGEPDAPEKTK